MATQLALPVHRQAPRRTLAATPSDSQPHLSTSALLWLRSRRLASTVTLEPSAEVSVTARSLAWSTCSVQQQQA